MTHWCVVIEDSSGAEILRAESIDGDAKVSRVTVHGVKGDESRDIAVETVVKFVEKVLRRSIYMPSAKPPGAPH